MNAKMIKDVSADFAGTALLFELDPPLETEYSTTSYQFVIASAAVTMDSGPETFIFPATKDGEVVSWLELDGSQRGTLDPTGVIRNLGYTVED